MLMTMLNTDKKEKQKRYNKKRKGRSAPKTGDDAKQLTSEMEENQTSKKYSRREWEEAPTIKSREKKEAQTLMRQEGE